MFLIGKAGFDRIIKGYYVMHCTWQRKNPSFPVHLEDFDDKSLL